MPAKQAKDAVTKYRALADLSLRKEPRLDCDEWFEWAAGDVFEPPAHMDMKKALKRGIVEEVKE